jgi:5-aminopentanamidase
VQAIIACGQFVPAPGDVRRNVQTMSMQAREAAHRGAALIAFPELCLSGYPSATAARAAAVTRDGAEMARVADCARAAGMALCFGFVESDPQGTLFNSLGLMTRDGELTAVYRKVHLWKGERAWATPGARFDRALLGAIPVGMWICYDTRFPEAARTLARAGATLGLVGSAWFGPAGEWELALRSRALDNGIFCAGAAVQGSAAEQPFHGASLIVDPHGNVLARAREGRAEVISAEYDSAEIDAFRARLSLFDDLRPGAYA